MDNKLTIMYVRVSENCNSNCFMCHYAGTNNSYNITEEQYDKLLTHMSNNSYKMIRFTGGEPLLHKNICSFIKKAKSINIKTSIITNGYLLPIKVKELIESGLDECVISLDGSTRELHDSLRNFPNCFNNIIKGINLIKKLKPDILIRINTVVSGLNIHDISNIYKLLISLNIDQWSIIPVKYKENLWKEDSINYYKEFIELVKNSNKIKFLGYSKYFAGTTKKEINETFNNIKMKSRNRCQVIDYVRFYIPNQDLLVPCNCISHRLKDIPIDISNDFEKGCQQIYKWLANNSNSCKGCEPLNVYINDHPEMMLEDEILY